MACSTQLHTKREDDSSHKGVEHEHLIRADLSHAATCGLMRAEVHHAKPTSQCEGNERTADKPVDTASERENDQLEHLHIELRKKGIKTSCEQVETMKILTRPVVDWLVRCVTIT